MDILPHATFYKIYQNLWKNGEECAPRGLRCKELTNFNYTLPPRVRFVSFDHRKLNLDYVKQEFCWYARGDSRDVSIAKLAKMWGGLVNADGSINSNYGWYLFNHQAGDGLWSNFARVVNELIKDPDSRRATTCILSNHHLNSVTQDYPCTAYLNWHIRGDKLVQYVRMRSQDAVFGLGNDAPCFSLIHELLWDSLKPFYPKLQLGDYHHVADSFHVYERHYQMIEKILDNPGVSQDHHPGCPAMSGRGAQFLQLQHVVNNLEMTPQGFDELLPFTQWLLTRDDPGTLLGAEYRV